MVWTVVELDNQAIWIFFKLLITHNTLAPNILVCIGLKSKIKSNYHEMGKYQKTLMKEIYERINAFNTSISI